MADFVPNFVAVATGVGHSRICLASFNSPTPKTPCYTQRSGDDRFRGLASAEGQILPFPIDFDGRPYNTLTLPCERVI